MKQNNKSVVSHQPEEIGREMASIYAAYNEQVTVDDAKLINKIVKEFTDRSRKDVKKWRESIEDLEHPQRPSRKKYIELIRELEIDLHYTSQKEVHNLAFLGKKFRITNDAGEEQEEKTARLKTPWFHEIQEKYMETYFSGTEVGEIAQVIDGEINKILWAPKANIVPERKEILLRSNARKGESYEDPSIADRIIELGEAEKFGLMYKIAPMIIWKRNALQAWADFCQLFGMPYRKATTNRQDKQTLDRIETMLKKMGSAAYGLFPEGTNIDLIETARQDAYNVYDKLIERANSEISKAINLVTMLSDDGSSKSQSEVHFKVNSAVVEARMTKFEFFVNYNLLEQLTKLGYPFDLTDRFEFDRTESLGKKDQWEIVNGVLQHYEVDPEYIEKKFGIPVTGLKQFNPSFNEGRQDPATGGLHAVIMPDFGNVCNHSIKAEADEEYKKLLEETVREVYEKENDVIPYTVHLHVAKKLQEAFSKSFKVSNEYNSPDNYKAAMYQANLFRFSAARTFTDVLNLNAIRKNSKGQDDFVMKAQAYANAKAHHLATEYTTSEAIAQNAANWLRQQKDAEDYDLMYQTAGDSNVRKSHRKLDGFTAPVDDRVWNRIYPPNAYNCRCEVVQVPKGSRTHTSKDQVDTDVVQKGFEGNRGKTNVIFRHNHEYFKEFPEVEKLNRRTYGLGRFSDKKGKLKFNTEQITDKNAFIRELKQQAHQFDGKAVYHTDFLGRSFEVSVDRFKNHFTGEDKVERFSMLHHIGEVMGKPDEVWMNEQNRKNNKYSSKYLKRYKNKVLVVVAGSEEEGKLSVKTWYATDYDENKLGNERTGILIKKD